MLSWLLPVITVIGLLFAIYLCVSGLEPLWKTKAATASLLAGCVALVLLINAAWQQGDEERAAHIILRWSARIACGLLLIFSGLAAWSLWLRVAQYGLTPERVMALVGVVIAVLYGLGYAVAAVMPKGRWLHLLAPVNIGLAFVVALICLCVLTPIADPYRLSAQSQGQRVNSGAVTPDKFDWRVLRFETGSYGLEELKRLSKSGKTEVIRKAAFTASGLNDADRFFIPKTGFPETKTPDRTQFAVVSPKGAEIPADFLTHAFALDEHLPDCATAIGKTPTCFVALLDLDHDQSNEIVILDEMELTTFTKHDGKWRALTSSYLSGKVSEDFKAGKIVLTPHRYDDFTIGASRTVRVAERNGDKDFVDY